MLGNNGPLLLIQYFKTPIDGQNQGGIYAKFTVGSAIKISIGL